ncbi:MAG: rRNA adenine N-6-methyltransferase family protein [Candidatus Peregrinibacteria bacterium]
MNLAPNSEESPASWQDIDASSLSPYAQSIVAKIQRAGIFAKTDKFDQHFLIDQDAIRTIADAAGITPGDSVLEIGPGPGNLTEEIWRICRETRVSFSTVELDAAFRSLLEELPESQLIRMVWGNAIGVLPEIAKEQGVNKIVANIPYSILEPLLQQIHTSKSIQSAVLLVGKRYAERAVADFRDENPKGERFSKTSLFSQARFVPEIVTEVPRESFIPQPRTESAVVRLNSRKGKNMNLFTVANLLIQKPTMRVRALLQNVLQQGFDKSKLRQIQSAEDAVEMQGVVPPRIDQLGFPDTLLNASLGSLTNDQLQSLLLKLDFLSKKGRRDRYIGNIEDCDDEQ